jgi:D-lactate dehydrogenase (cytochrome)
LWVLAPILGHVGDGNFHTFLIFNPNEANELKRAEELSARIAM